MSQQENLRELFALIEANPNLPIIPLVDSEIVADCNLQRWCGSWGSASVKEFLPGSERIFFRDDEDWDEIEAAINDVGPKATVDFPWDDELLAAYQALPWRKAIVVKDRKSVV